MDYCDSETVKLNELLEKEEGDVADLKIRWRIGTFSEGDRVCEWNPRVEVWGKLRNVKERENGDRDSYFCGLTLLLYHVIHVISRFTSCKKYIKKKKLFLLLIFFFFFFRILLIGHKKTNYYFLSEILVFCMAYLRFFEKKKYFIGDKPGNVIYYRG